MDGFDDYVAPYSAERVRLYLDRIKLPRAVKLGVHDPRQDTPEAATGQEHPNLQALSYITACHLSSIPFEVLALHYTGLRPPYISVEPNDVFDKLVIRQRGGYCMEQNMLLYHILRALGFNVYTTGARVHTRTGGFAGWLAVPR